MYHYKIRSTFSLPKEFQGKKKKEPLYQKGWCCAQNFLSKWKKRLKFVHLKEPELKKLLTLGGKQNFAISDINIICSMSELELLQNYLQMN